MDDKITFSYNEFVKNKLDYPDSYGVARFHNQNELLKLKEELNRVDGFCNDYETAMIRLEQRTTNKYYQKVYAAQTRAQSYATLSFPAYKYLLPETLADDWNSTVDWHKAHATRDHSLHQPLTAYIVQNLLGYGDASKSLLTPKGRLLDICIQSLLYSPRTEYLRSYFQGIYPEFQQWDLAKKELWASNLFYEVAVVAAFFHDIGYPWQFVQRLKSHIEIGNYAKSQINLEQGDSLYSFLQNRLLVCPFFGYLPHNVGAKKNTADIDVEGAMSSAYKKSHGFPGALAFLALADKTFKFPDVLDHNAATTKLKTEWAAVAIMMHDMEGLYSKGHNYFKLSFDVDPLSCIIAMADVLEEFERPNAVFENDEDDHRDVVHLSYNVHCVATHLSVVGTELKIVYEYDTQEEAIKNEEWRKKEITKYFEPSIGFIDLSALGIDKTECKTYSKP